MIVEQNRTISIESLSDMKLENVKHDSSVSQSIIESEIRYRRLFEAAQDGILILDAETGMIEDVNPFLIDMLGYSREEFLKKKNLGSWCICRY